MFKLENNRLQVEIDEPGELYHGSRFDWTGFITQVTLDGQHTYCVPESLVPGQGSGGCGICNEFGIAEPLGYEDVAPGGYFPKIGVGLLKRPDQKPYDFFRPYEIIPFPVTVLKIPNGLKFLVEPLECNGYLFELEKTITIKENKLQIDYILSNRGAQAIRTTEYCHNFIGINRQSVGADYKLEFLYSPQLVPADDPETQEPLLINGREISWKFKPETDFYGSMQDFFREQPHKWTLRHQPTKKAVSEESFFTPQRVALWGQGHVISPEVFIAIKVNPGERQQWSRNYTFS
ncbi:MAG TPA: hypothetical protein DD734_09865 [Firmicutes bacterium]|nr:hypothetical protein [Bacillota bacterium]